jgi:hypothetical protein
MFKKRESILFLLLAAGITALNLVEVWEVNILTGIGKFLLYFLFLWVMLFAIYRFLKNRKQVPFAQNFKPLLLSLMFVAFFFLQSFLMERDGGKKIKLTAFANHDPAYIHLILFTDGTFRYLNSGPFGGSYERGTYTFRSDTLLFTKDKGSLPNLTLPISWKEIIDKKPFFESLDTGKFKYRLYITKDKR